jgi:tetratricopeptide (TPR) repeat protein
VVPYVLLVLMLGVVLSGCERKQVYIPPEYSAPPVAPLSGPASQPAAPSFEQVRPAVQEPELGSEQTHTSTAPGSPAMQNRFAAQSGPAAEQKQPKKLTKEDAAKSPQRQASMQQVDQARGQLEKGKTDAAIRTLEKAVRIDAGNGEAFILLARAWKQKGEKRKALEFAKKAELLCQRQPAKLREVYSLESDLYRELEESTKNGHKLRQRTPDAPQKIQ